jgi:hypothetical protein
MTHRRWLGLALALAVLVSGAVAIQRTGNKDDKSYSAPSAPAPKPQVTTPQATKLPSATPAPTTAPAAPRRVPHFGTFVSEAPASPSELATAKHTIDEVRVAGLSVVYQYSFVQGTTDLNKEYLDYAQSKGVQVIIDMHDLYDSLSSYPQGDSRAAWLMVLSGNFGQHFTSNDQVVDYVVGTFGPHPAVWGFSTSDEQPEDANGLSVWRPILAKRYARIKHLSSKPVLLTAIGDQPSSFFRSLRGTGDQLATDYYPVGNKAASEPTAITRIAHDAKTAGWSGTWAVLQAFDMRDTDYGMPDVAGSSAHFPSVAELVHMGGQAKRGNAGGVLFFAWGAVQLHHQQATVKAAVQQLLQQFE